MSDIARRSSRAVFGGKKATSAGARRRRGQQEEGRRSAPSQPDTTPSTRSSDLATLIDAAWHFLASRKLALALILLITLAALFGMLLIQVPSGIAGDPVAYKQWLEQVRPKYGVWTELFSRLQLFMVFQTAWFRLLVVLLALNILVCTAQRWRGLWNAATKTPGARLNEGAFLRARLATGFEVSGVALEDVSQRVESVLRRCRFRVLSERDSQEVYFYADRNRFARLATAIHHLSIVLVLLGAVYGQSGGFAMPGFMVAMGSERPIGQGTDLAVRLDSFVDEYYVAGPPKDFRSDVVVLEQGVEVRRQTVRVNSPLIYKGVRIHQSFFGPAVVMRVAEPNGRVLFEDGIPLGWKSQERPVGSFVLPEQGLEVFVVAPASSFVDPIIRPGQARLEVYRRGDNNTPLFMSNADQGTPLELGKLTYTFLEETRFSGFQVVKDPGLTIIWAAFAGIVVGMMVVLYFPHRRLWAMCKQKAPGSVEVRFLATPERAKAFEETFSRIAGDAEREVKGSQERSTTA